MNLGDYIETLEQTVDTWHIVFSGLQCQKVWETLWPLDFSWKEWPPLFCLPFSLAPLRCPRTHQMTSHFHMSVRHSLRCQGDKVQPYPKSCHTLGSKWGWRPGSLVARSTLAQQSTTGRGEISDPWPFQRRNLRVGEGVVTLWLLHSRGAPGKHFILDQ